MQIQTNGLTEVTVLRTGRSQFEVSNEKPRKWFFKKSESKNQGVMQSYKLQLQV